MKGLFKNAPLFLVLISVAIIFTFLELPKTFYQQDEWQTLGHNLSEGIGVFTRYASPFQLLLGEQRPLAGILNLFFLGYFKFTVVPIFLFGAVLHIVNSFIVYFLTRKLTGNTFIGILASLFFSLNSISHQAITWASAVNTIPSTTLILLSILFYLKYLDGKKKKFLHFSFFGTVLSLFFKETALFLFILYPFLYFLYKKNVNIATFIRDHLLLLSYGFLVVGVRLAEIFLRSENVAGFVKGSENFIESVIFHSILYPSSSLFQIFIPPLDLYSITSTITTMQYKFLVGSPLKDLVAQSIVADMVSILGSMAILGLLVLIAYRYKNKVTNRSILFGLAFLLLSFLPYIVIHRESSYLSSRYFYVGAVGAGILFGYVVYFLTNFNKYLKWGVLFLVFLYLFHHASIIRNDIDYQVKLGNERETVLNGIRELKPTLDNKTVFYVTSDKEYYGPITNPFQNGLGYVLEVWYYDSGKIPKEFLSENFLWDLGTEGYKELGDKGFGYFQDIDKMVAEMQKSKLKADIAHAFFIRSSDSKVLDITSEIRARISTISAAEK